MRRFIENTGFWLLVTLCVLLFAVFIAQFFGIHRYLVVSGSMEPTLYAGDIVFVNTNVDFDDVKIGDVIIFQYENMNIIHRVVEIGVVEDDGEKRLKTKGDNNKNADGYLTKKENFSGVVAYVIPKIGFLIDYKNLINK